MSKPAATSPSAPRGRGPMGHGPGPAMMPGEKVKDFKGSLKKTAALSGEI